MSTEQRTEQKEEVQETRALTVGDMEVNQFFALLLQIIDRNRGEGNDKLMDMSVKDFTELMIDQIRNRSLAAAQAESGTAERILTDWKGLQNVGAVSQPFRVVKKEQLDEFYRDLAQHLVDPNFRGEFVIAVGIVEAGAYRSAR